MPHQQDTDFLQRLARLLGRLRPWKPARLLATGKRALAAGDQASAAIAFESCRRRAPAWAEPWYELSRCARAAGDPIEAVEALLLGALERNPGHTAAEAALLELRAWRYTPLTEAWHLYHGARLNDALAAFDAALDCTGTRLPELARGRVLAGLGWCHHDLGALHESALAFEQALLCEPSLAHAHKGLGIVLYKLGRYVEAEHSLEAAVGYEPKLHDALAFIGWCHYATGRYADALAVFQRVQAANPILGDAAWGTAWSLWRLADTVHAPQAFRAAAQLDPAHPSAADVARFVLQAPHFEQLAQDWGALLVSANPAPAKSETSEQRRPLVEALSAMQEQRPEDCLEILRGLQPRSSKEEWQARILEARATRALEDSNPDRLDPSAPQLTTRDEESA